MAITVRYFADVLVQQEDIQQNEVEILTKPFIKHDVRFVVISSLEISNLGFASIVANSAFEAIAFRKTGSVQAFAFLLMPAKASVARSMKRFVI